MTPTCNVLVLCTGNSARSLLAESLFIHRSQGRVHAFSAGSKPRGEPHPLAIALLKARGHETKYLRSKSWHEFAVPGAPMMDLVVTVCDSAAGESCPLWPGAPLKTHWGIPDPAAATGSEADQRSAFELAYKRLDARVGAFLALPFETMAISALQRELARIGHLEGATALATGTGKA
ncbi:MAG: arsenate reductase ArsC [Hyphomicrobiaceae bacterium]